MQNFLGKMARVASLFSGNQPAAVSAPTDRRDEEMKILAAEFHTHLTDSLRKNKDGSEIIMRLTELDCPLCDKYEFLQVEKLLNFNNESLEGLKHILASLNVIIKYAQHLIKKSEERREQWRIIPFNNSIIQRKVSPMKGYLMVLQQLGYTSAVTGGLSYPSGAEPNEEVIIRLIADMMLFRKEIKEYIAGRHLHPRHLEQFIPSKTQLEVRTAQLNGQKCEDEDFSETSSTQISFIPHGGETTDQVVLDQTSVSGSAAIQDTQKVLRPIKTEYNNNSVSEADLQAVVNKTNELSLSVNVERESSPMLASTKEQAYETQQAQTPSAQVQAPSAQVQAIQDLVSPAGDVDTVTSESNSGVSSSFRPACTVCGDDATVYCEECTNKPLCEGCNINWHKHPNRQGHSQKCISALTLLSPESISPVHIDGAYGISAQTKKQLIRLSEKQQTHLVNQKSPNKMAGGNPKLYSPELLRRLHTQEGETSAGDFYQDHIMRDQKQVHQSSEHQRIPKVNAHPEQYYQHQPLHFQQHFSVSGFDPELYQGHPLYSSPSVAYPSNVQGYHNSHVNTGHQFRADRDILDPRSFQKQLVDSSDLMNNYHEEVNPLKQQHTLPAMQQQQSQAAVQQQPVWYLQNRSHNPYQNLSQSQSMGDVSPVSYIPAIVVPSSVYHPNPAYPSSFYQPSQQQVMRLSSSHPIRGSPLLHQQSLLLQSNMDPQMSGSVHNPHQMNMSGMFVGNQNFVNSQIHHQKPSVALSIHGQTELREPAYQIPRQLSGSSSTSSLSSILCSLFDQLKQIPDIKKRLAQCEIYINKTVNDIDFIEQTLNSGMEVDIEFCETEQFRSLNKQKALLMQQKKYLEEYRQQLEDETIIFKMKSDEEMSQQIHYPPDVELSFQTSSKNKRLSEPVASSERILIVPTTVVDLTSSSTSDYRPVMPNTNNAAILSSIPAGGSSQAARNKDINSKTAVEVLNAASTQNECSETSDMKGALPKNGQSSRVAVEINDKSGGVPTSAPVIPPRIPRKENILSRTLPPPKAAEVTDAKNWHCQHCTFINEASFHVCVMCDKTSDNPLLTGISDDDNSEDNDTCIKGSEDSLEGDKFLDLLTKLQKAEQRELAKKKENDKKDEKEFHAASPNQNIGSRICGSQEEVMVEKKRAQQEFMQQKQREQQAMGAKSSVSQTSPTHRHRKSVSPVSSTENPSKVKGEKQKPLLTLRPEVEASEHCSSSMSGYYTPPSTVSPVPSVVQHTSASVQDQGQEDKKNTSLSSCDSTLEDTLARYNENSMIDNMRVQGAEFAKLIKMADQEGFDIEAVQIAQNSCEIQKMSPIEWLQKHWKKNINMVMNMAVAAGNKEQQNSVGEVSEEEARNAYITCHGNMKDAAQLCVRNRTELYEYLSAHGSYPREEILQAMFQCCGNKEAAEKLLTESQLQPFLKNIWAEKAVDSSNRFVLDLASPPPEMCHSFSTSIIFHGDFQKMVMNKDLNRERRIRMIFVEGKLKSWGRAELVVKILDNDLPDENVSLEDVVEAVRNCQDKTSALAYLQQECALCFTNFPMSKIRNLNFCQCKMCEQCLTKNFEIAIREKHVRHWTCPLCSQPDMNDTDVASDYLLFLILLLQPLIDKDLQNLFEIKVRDWHLQKDVSFRWCAHCAEGFLAENQGGNLRMTCPHCQEKTCFYCKKQWEPQHEGLTCEQFAQWKIDNDPTNQSVGLAKHLDENGIDCPTCKMRFALAKGGCMHFKCPQCGHEFCSGCNEPFHQKDVCTKYKMCRKLGLHCHCPRDCFSYLRDYPVQHLQKLLQRHNVAFNTNPPEDQTDPFHCPVMEQKEFDAGKKDERCGKDTIKGQAGLCQIHYKEYLVYIINRHKIDPVVLMTKEEMSNILDKYDLPVPKQKSKESPEEYISHLMKMIQEKLPLRRR